MSKVLTYAAAVLAWQPRLSVNPALPAEPCGAFLRIPGSLSALPPQREAASAVWRLGFWGST